MDSDKITVYFDEPLFGCYHLTLGTKINVIVTGESKARTNYELEVTSKGGLRFLKKDDTHTIYPTRKPDNNT